MCYAPTGQTSTDNVNINPDEILSRKSNNTPHNVENGGMVLVETKINREARHLGRASFFRKGELP